MPKKILNSSELSEHISDFMEHKRKKLSSLADDSADNTSSAEIITTIVDLFEQQDLKRIEDRNHLLKLLEIQEKKRQAERKQDDDQRQIERKQDYDQRQIERKQDYDQRQIERKQDDDQRQIERKQDYDQRQIERKTRL